MTDPKFAMRESISSSIYYMLNGDKSKQSILNYVPWTLDELILHIESKFENWMSWDNRGIYSKATWDDNDPSTWKWHLDHIVPHSSFQYSSMEDDEFKKCWSLDNLRPYSAKQNVIDGARNV